MAERVQKLLAAAGLGSRREIERWISAGRLSVNGRIVRLGDQADPADDIRLDGKRLRLRAAPGAARVLLYHKPLGEISTRRDPEGRPTVFERLPRLKQGRWIAIGRLDANSCGLMLFTTDGELANALMHPSQQIEREYAVRVLGEASPAQLRELRSGVRLDDGPARFDRIEPGGASGVNHWYRIVIREGRRREVRRLWEAIGLTVSRLMRVRFGPVPLPRDLPRGKWRELPADGVAALYDAAGLSAEQ